MNDSTTIHLREWNSETGRTEETGVTLSVFQIAKSLSKDNFSKLLEEFLNLGGKGYREGLEIRRDLRSSHRTLQRLAICFAFGLIVGLSDQKYTDPRNETAIETAKKVTQMIANDELPMGLYI